MNLLQYENIIQSFEKTAEQYKSSIAVIEVGTHIRAINYEQLNCKANQYANLLLSRKICSGTKIAISIYDKLEQISAMLGILKAACCYVPIQNNLSQYAILDVLKQSEAEYMISDNPVLSKLSFCKATIAPSETENYGTTSPGLSLAASMPAYCIMTSGTKGPFKDVTINHHGLFNTIQWRVKEYQYNQSDTTLQLLNESFDAYALNLYCSLLSGGRLVCLSNSSRWDIPLIIQTVIDFHITNTSLTPSMLRALLDFSSPEAWGSLRFVVIGGEKPDIYLAEICRDYFKNSEIIQEYGLTECSIVSSYCRNWLNKDINNIGYAINNTDMFILNDTEADNYGEICISGHCIADGYGELLKAEGPLVYRTGDYGKMAEDGSLLYISRKDDQVKISGYRFTIEAVETLLNTYDGIKDARVLVQEQSPSVKNLCVFYKTKEIIDIDILIKWLSSRLPYYMVPRKYIRIEEWPLTSNGKIDNKDLLSRLNTKIESSEPTNVIEELQSIWSQLINHPINGIDTSFFDAGGNSLLLMDLFFALQAKYSDTITVNDLFEHNTIRQQAAFITSITGIEEK